MGVLAPPPIGQNDTLSLLIGQMKSKGANKNHSSEQVLSKFP